MSGIQTEKNIDLWIDINCDTGKYPDMAKKVVTLLSETMTESFKLNNRRQAILAIAANFGLSRHS